MDIVVLQLSSTGGASKMIKPLYCYSVAVFFICDPSKGEKSLRGTAERKENVQWTFLAKGRGGALAK